MIGQTLGPGHAAVTVAADLDMSKSTLGRRRSTREPVAGHRRPDHTQNDSKETVRPGAARGTTNGQLGVGRQRATPRRRRDGHHADDRRT